MPDLPIEKGRPGPGLVANVVVSKYLDGLPLYRQWAILAREGIEIERATLAVRRPIFGDKQAHVQSVHSGARRGSLRMGGQRSPSNCLRSAR